MNPGVELVSALQRVLLGEAIGPLAQRRLDRALGLAIGLWVVHGSKRRRIGRLRELQSLASTRTFRRVITMEQRHESIVTKVSVGSLRLVGVRLRRSTTSCRRSDAQYVGPFAYGRFYEGVCQAPLEFRCSVVQWIVSS